MTNRIPSHSLNADRISSALVQSFVKLKPGILLKNPVMAMVGLGTAVMVVVSFLSMIQTDATLGSPGYNWVITVILLLTVVFGNFAEAIAEAKGKAQADSLRKTRQDT